MESTLDIRISVTIMCHPSRRARLAKLVEWCAPLMPRIISDPEPKGTPSPLRTAKIAWATVGDNSTHHLVLQDDVVLTAGFAQQLAHALAARPHHALALYSNWNSPRNSYLVRRATAAGSPWAPLSPLEWTPTEALVLPVDQARGLAGFLAAVPDEVSDDDEVASVFFRERGLPVFATVPHLVDHADEPTLAGHPGSYHATVYADGCPLSRDHWTAAPRTTTRLAERVTHPSCRDFVVELTGSRCLLRFIGPASREPVEHPYGWYWYDCCGIVGVDPERLLSTCEAFLADEARTGGLTTLGLGLPTLVEIWAACYLLGIDATARGDASGDPRWPEETQSKLLRDAVASWIDSGLDPLDRNRLDDGCRSRLVDLGVASVTCGRAGKPPASRHAITGRAPSHRSHPPRLEHIVQRMARREAAAHFLTPPYVPASSILERPAVALRIVECPRCGADDEADDLSSALWTLLRNGHAVLAATDTSPDHPTIAMLSCEWLTARSILPVIVLAEVMDEGCRSVFKSRAVTWAEDSIGPEMCDDAAERLIRRIDSTERWVDALHVTRDAQALRRVVDAASQRHGGLTLPASTRLRDRNGTAAAGLWGRPPTVRADRAEVRRTLQPHFLTPHCSGSLLAWLDLRYLETRLGAVQTSFSSRNTSITL